MEITTVGLDIAKRVFQLHGVDGAGKAVLRRKLQRSEVLAFFKALPPCLVGIEACGTAHYWAREIRELGHEVRLMPPSYVAPYVKRGKTDAADATAICEAETRPTMRFVPIKTAEQQAVLMLHRTRDLLVRQRTMLVNALRGHMAELGVIAPQGIARVADLVAILLGEDATNVPALAREAPAVQGALHSSGRSKAERRRYLKRSSRGRAPCSGRETLRPAQRSGMPARKPAIIA